MGNTPPPPPFVPGSLDDPNLIVTPGEGYAPCEWCLIEEQPDKKSDCPGCGHPRKKAEDEYRVHGKDVRPKPSNPGIVGPKPKRKTPRPEPSDEGELAQKLKLHSSAWRTLFRK